MKRALFFGAASALVLAGSASAANLWDNGPLITHPGGGFNGADASALQVDLGMGTYGYGHQFNLGYSIADDFEVGAGGWNIDSIDFFAYQTGSSTNSTITGVYAQIYDGQPGAGGNVIWGDMATNLLTATGWTGIYRSKTDDLTGSTRPIMQNTATIGTTLAAGTYWVEWACTGSLSSGPWAPPITILGQIGTGNGLQSLDYSGTFNPAIDLEGQGFPFLIEGSVVPAPGALALLGLAGLARRRRR